MIGGRWRRFLQASVVFLGVGLALLGCDQLTDLDRSVIGSRGLRVWLEQNDIAVLPRPRHSEYSADDVSLRILPLLDTQAGGGGRFRGLQMRAPDDDTQRHIALSDILEKLQLKKTLLILPKWLSAVPLRDEVHSSLLIHSENKNLSVLLRKLGLGALELVYPGEKFQTVKLQDAGQKGFENANRGTLTLYSPQVFRSSSLGIKCVALVASTIGVLIAKCMLDVDHIRAESAPTTPKKRVSRGDAKAPAFEAAEVGPYETEFYVLSDPDLMNNHGLSLAGNGAFALEVVNALRVGNAHPVFVDTTVKAVLRRAGTKKPERRHVKSSTDLTKFFIYPFSLLWVSGLLVFVVALWRGSVRFGPPVRMYFDQVEASKRASVHAKAHILRLSGQDQALAAEFTRNQMRSLAIRFLGEAGSGDDALLRKRLLIIAPEFAEELIQAADTLYSIDTQISAAELARRIDYFDTQYRRVSDAIGHISRRY